jgi:hypothetical protein
MSTDHKEWTQKCEELWKQVSDKLDENRPIVELMFAAVEDIGQVTCGDWTIDVGWYPEHDPDGSFLLMVTNKGNWDWPIIKLQSSTLAQLDQQLKALAVLPFR